MTGPHGDTNLLEHLLAKADFNYCPSCKGEGWHYVELYGRLTPHPIAEHPCRTCNQTGERP
jgi:hypothetical protein